MIPFESLPAVNAFLNAASAAALIVGRVLVARKRVEAHRRAMLAAFGISVLFLASYLVYHARMGSTRFEGTGWIRPVYFVILVSHTILAATVPVLAVMTLRRAFRGEIERHRRLARWTFPIWLYVSVTGVAVYVLLYHVGPRLS